MVKFSGDIIFLDKNKLAGMLTRREGLGWGMGGVRIIWDGYNMPKSLKSEHCKHIYMLLGFLPANRSPVMTTSTMSMRQDRSTAFLGGGGGVIRHMTNGAQSRTLEAEDPSKLSRIPGLRTLPEF